MPAPAGPATALRGGRRSAPARSCGPRAGRIPATGWRAPAASGPARAASAPPGRSRPPAIAPAPAPSRDLRVIPRALIRAHYTRGRRRSRRESMRIRSAGAREDDVPLEMSDRRTVGDVTGPAWAAVAADRVGLGAPLGRDEQVARPDTGGDQRRTVDPQNSIVPRRGGCRGCAGPRRARSRIGRSRRERTRRSPRPHRRLAPGRSRRGDCFGLRVRSRRCARCSRPGRSGPRRNGRSSPARRRSRPRAWARSRSPSRPSHDSRSHTRSFGCRRLPSPAAGGRSARSNRRRSHPQGPFQAAGRTHGLRRGGSRR